MAQIREFESTTESYFILDGVSYPKVYEAMLDSQYSDTKIKLVGTNRDTTPLVFSTQYTNIRVDGDSFDTALEAISRLNQIVFSKGGGSGGGGTSNQNSINRIPSATYSELGITPESTIEEKQTAISAFLEGYDNVETDNLFFEIKEDEPSFNFDVTGNWNLTTDGDDNPTPITDAVSFKTWLESGWTSEQYESPNSFADVVVSDFSLVGGRLTANVTTSGGYYFALEGLEITQVNSVSISDFTALGLAYNQITTFNPTIALPTGLEHLKLNDNQITNFNPTIALPTGLQGLDLSSNQITTFNPTLPLPSGLKYLYFNNNQLTDFNPTIALPTGLQTLGLYDNQIIDWSLSEPWANSLPNGTGVIRTRNNPTSSNGTNFKTILESKGYTVIS